MTRAQKIEAKQAGRAWAERRALEVRDRSDPAHGIFDAEHVYVGDLGEDGWYYAYLASAAAAHWWGKKRGK